MNKFFFIALLTFIIVIIYADTKCDKGISQKDIAEADSVAEVATEEEEAEEEIEKEVNMEEEELPTTEEAQKELFINIKLRR